MRDSQLAEQRRRVAEAIRAESASGATRRNPARRFDEGPFGNFRWVFGANILLGLIGGLFAVRTRRSRESRDAGTPWLILGGCAGMGLAFLVVVFFFLVLGVFSIMSGSISPSMLFAFSAPVVALGALGFAFDTRQRRSWRNW